MNARIKKSAVGLSALFTISYLFYCVYCLTRIGGEYLPFWTDEFNYLSDTNSFLKTGDLGASIVFNETFSKIGDFGYHGFAYTLYDGIFAKILGLPENTNIVFVNALTFAFSLLLLALLPRIGKSEKIILSALYCSNWVVSAYLFTYMQEIAQLPTALLASYLLFRSYTDKENSKSFVAAFIILILLASVLRLNWIFWLIGLFPLLRDGKKIILWGAGFILLSLIAFLSYPQINAVYPNGFLKVINVALAEGNYRYAAASMVWHFISNVLNYLSPADDANWAYTLCNMLPLAGAVLFLFTADRAVKRFYFAITLIIGVNLFALFTFYDVLDWREVRIMAPIVYLIFAALAFTKSDALTLIALAMQLVFSVSNYQNVEAMLAMRRNVYNVYLQKSDLCRQLDSLSSQATTATNPATVLILADELYGDGIPEMLCLPFINSDGRRLRYSVNMRRPESEFGAAQVDYLITQKPFEDDSFEEIQQSGSFKLYRKSQVSR